MVLDGLRAYLQLANGLTEVTRQRAITAAKALVAQGEAALPEGMRTQVSVLAEELSATSKANRDLLVGLVRTEVDRSVARLGLVSAGELETVVRKVGSLDVRIKRLEGSKAGLKPTAKKAPRPTPTSTRATAPAKSPTRKSSTKKAGR